MIIIITISYDNNNGIGDNNGDNNNDGNDSIDNNNNITNIYKSDPYRKPDGLS